MDMDGTPLRATVLVDNKENNGLGGEWGLSIYMEYGDRTLLLDTGASDLFWENAQKMGIDLSKVDCAVLSHAHYDHADGMQVFFDRTPQKTKMYLRDSCRENCYRKTLLFYKYIGIPHGILEKNSDRLEYAVGDLEIYPGVFLIPHKTPNLRQVGQACNMYIRKKGKFIPDSFEHEQSLVFETPEGLVIFNSCSHGGADNIITEIAETFPGKKIAALIGGFHLFEREEADVRALADRIRETGIDRVYTGHCTGDDAFTILRDELGDMVQGMETGSVMIFRK